jgi:hypothetical protein
MNKRFFSILFILCFFQGFANELGTPKRIQSLLPDLGKTFNIEPYIPDDFRLVQPEEEENYFWMPDGLYDKYMADSTFVHRPFIQVIVMKGSENDNNKNFAKQYVSELKTQFPVHSSSLHWGDYEVTAIKMNVTADDEYMAFVDLNRNDGCFIIFHLAYYKKNDYGNGNKPSKEELDFWNDFLNKTKAF